MNTKIKFFGLIVMLFCAVTGQSFDKYDLTKTISQEYDLRADGTLDIYNKYGKVDIKTWDKQVAKIDIVIKVDARNDKKAQEMMDRIDVVFTNKPDYVSAKTTFSEDRKVSYQNSYNAEYTIDYTIYMPKNAHLKIFNKYGNTEIEALDKSVAAEIKYGDLSMDNVIGDVDLQLGYGNAKMKDMASLTAQVKYSNVEAGNTGDLKMDSKYSQFEFNDLGDASIQSKYDTYSISKVKKLSNDGKYDDFDIKEAEAVNFETKYTDIEIDFLHYGIEVEQKYGDVEIKELGSKADYLTFNLEYTDVTVRRMNTGYSLDMEGEHSDYKIHSDFSTTYHSDEDECCDIEVKGNYGNGQTKIYAKLDYGHLKLL